jgi:hypothetical protein
MRFFSALLARFRAWKAKRTSHRLLAPTIFNFSSSHLGAIHREVTPNGVRVFSLCVSCGATLQASATLCDDCAQKRSKSRPYWA